MRIYATAEQLAAPPWGVTADSAEQLIRAASVMVDTHLRLAVYPTGDDGYPTGELVAGVLRDAVCAQAAQWAALGINPALGPAGVEPARSSVQLGPATIQYAGAETTAAAKAATLTGLCDEALAILANAGLLSGRVWVYG